ncbi:hypothetical protein [Nesterenkonia halobia]|uniref:Uncharacterized protein n=1 Tax=Nesterenkonia halobia TaxID=37922 RepID=A0ABP6R800_9MICC
MNEPHYVTIGYHETYRSLDKRDDPEKKIKSASGPINRPPKMGYTLIGVFDIDGQPQPKPYGSIPLRAEQVKRAPRWIDPARDSA